MRSITAEIVPATNRTGTRVIIRYAGKRKVYAVEYGVELRNFIIKLFRDAISEMKWEGKWYIDTVEVGNGFSMYCAISNKNKL